MEGMVLTFYDSNQSPKNNLLKENEQTDKQ